MRLSRYFLPLLREDPASADIISHKLMLRAGMIKQSCAGIYSWLPLGLKILHRIQDIVRQNLNAAGCVELLMPCIQDANLWQESSRYDDYGKEMLKMQDRHGHDMLFGPTNEELITDIFRNSIRSYKDLPKNFYQIQWKFRDEIRPRFGVMRSREFLMKDAYSFDIDADNAKHSYNLMYDTYLAIFKDLGVKIIAVQADNGAIGGNLSHEFHIIAPTGDSTIYYDNTKFNPYDNSQDLSLQGLELTHIATAEKHKNISTQLTHDQISSIKGIEVGHIFNFGTKYSHLMQANIHLKTGDFAAVEMGSYGIGISRLVGAIIEASHDQYGIVWPINIAPFTVSIINLLPKDENTIKVSENIYQMLLQQKIDVLLDDTLNQAGGKLATHNLIGVPYQIIIGKKFINSDMIEFRSRNDNNTQTLTLNAVINQLSTIFNSNI